MNLSDKDIAIKADAISKTYKLYEKQSHRLKEALNPFKKQYAKDFHALKNISFTIHKGETIGIIGKNGSGKSTLLQILCGILLPTSGTVQTTGKISSLLELGTGFNAEYNGIDNIYLNASIMGMSDAQINEKLDAIIQFADIGDFIYQPVKTYSSGMYVRLAFAIQANIDPDILIVDEALAVGDAQFVHRCMLRFHQLQKEGKTILLVTHDASSVKSLCSRALWLKNGELIAMGDSNVVVDQYLNDLFITEESTSSRDIPATENTNTNTFDPLTYEERLGDNSFEILGLSFKNSDGIKTKCINQHSEIRLSIACRNNSVKTLTPLIGLILKDPKGLEIGSTISRMEGFSFSPVEPKKTLTAEIVIHIPRLYPGPYALTPTVSYMENDKDIIADRLVNAITFDIIASGECHTLLSLDTSYHEIQKMQ